MASSDGHAAVDITCSAGISNDSDKMKIVDRAVPMANDKPERNIDVRTIVLFFPPQHGSR